MQKPFRIEVGNLSYHIKPYCEVDCSFYEVFTSCKKLFTLKKGSDGTWKTNETNIVPITGHVIESIGNAIDEHLMF